MKLLRYALLAACASISIAAASLAPAAAADRSFSINPAGLHRGNGATGGEFIGLPKSGGIPFVVINFVVPQDHAENTPITVRLLMQHFHTGVCTAATILGAATRRRVGKAQSTTFFPNVDRINPAGGVEATSFPETAGIVVAKTFIVRSPRAAPFKKLTAGDGIVLHFERFSSNPSDTCLASVNIYHIDVTYTSTAAP